jgi:hypothetical protein
VVIDDLNVVSTGGGPSETHTELVVHADAVLPGTVALERLKPVTGRHLEILKPACDLQLTEFSTRNRFDTREPLDSMAAGKGLRIGTPER